LTFALILPYRPGMDRRRFLLASLGVFVAPLPADAQQQRKIWRIGSVLAGSPETTGHIAKAIEASLATAGYVNGRNITLQHQFYPPHPAGAEEVLRAIVPTIDLLVVGGTIGGVAAKKVTTALPTVFLSIGDPVRVGLVSSLAHPGGNMTGVTFEAAAETYGKRLQLLKEILPGLTLAGILRVPGDANIVVAMESLERIAPPLHVTLRSFDIKTVDDLTGAFAMMKSSGVQAVLVVAGAFTYTHGRRIAELALTHRLPSGHAFRETVAAGGLFSLGPDIVAMAPQVAAYVDKIIKGANPGDLPVEQPARYETYINLKTAKALGLTIPPSLLARADQVLE
jgi:putative tryptophan/tyrosine transport system substrate-binding protein